MGVISLCIFSLSLGLAKQVVSAWYKLYCSQIYSMGRSCTVHADSGLKTAIFSLTVVRLQGRLCSCYIFEQASHVCISTMSSLLLAACLGTCTQCGKGNVRMTGMLFTTRHLQHINHVVNNVRRSLCKWFATLLSIAAPLAPTGYTGFARPRLRLNGIPGTAGR